MAGGSGTDDKRALLEKLLQERALRAPVRAPAPRNQVSGELAPTSFAQRRLWFLDLMYPGGTQYLVPGALRLVGELNLIALERSLGDIVRRHDVFRTRFVVVEGEPFQAISPPDGFSLPCEDLSALPAAERRARVQARLEEEIATPFELSKGPLIRMRLLRLQPREHLLLISLHHAVTDGWSRGVFFRELTALYGAYARNEEAVLPPLPIQYADFAQWQRTRFATHGLAEQLAYWRKALAGVPAVLPLPTDRPRPAVQSFNGRVMPAKPLPAALVERATAAAKQEGVTLFMLLEAAFTVLLARYTGQLDFCVGVPLAGRSRAETEGVIGLFINTLPLRSALSGNPSFRELVKRTRAAAVGAYAHQDIPFEQLIEELQPPRSTGHTPFFQVLFDVDKGSQAPALHGLTVENVPDLPFRVSKYDFSFYFTEEAGGLSAAIEYNADLFDHETMERFERHFETLLEGLLQHPDRPALGVPFLSEAEKAEVLVELNRVPVDWARVGLTAEEPLSFPAAFERQAALTPDAPAARFGDEKLSYAQLNARANEVAHALLAAGVTPDSVVGLLLERSLHFLVGMLAVFKAGAAYTPLDPSSPPLRLKGVVDQARCTALLCLSSSAPLASSLLSEPSRVLRLDALPSGLSSSNPGLVLSPRRLAYVIFTSGSTGTPKGAMVDHGGMHNHLRAKVHDLRLTSRDVLVETAPASFDISVWQFLVALRVGGSVVIADDDTTKDPLRLLRLVADCGITVLEIVPSLLGALLDTLPSPAPKLPSLRWLMLTGEALPPSLCTGWLRHYPSIPLVNAYGPTECSDDVTHHFLSSPPDESRGRTPIGRPIPNLLLYVLNSHLQPVPRGVEGELFVAGAGVGRGYLRDPVRTADVFLPNPFASSPGDRLYRTGDLCRFLPDGTLEFLGRIDHQVKVRGFRIELGEIEAALLRHPSIREAVVLARQDVPGDKQLCAYFLSSAEVSSSALTAHLRQYLPEYMVPAAFVSLPAWPLTPNGKLDRSALPAPDSLQNAADFVPPQGPLQELLASLWAQLLNVPRVGANDNFFQLGGHSLLAMRLVSQIRRSLSLELPIRALFEEPTLSRLASRLQLPDESEAASAIPPLRPLPRTEHLATSFAQERLWFLDQLFPGVPVHNIPLAQRLTGPLDVKAMEQALSELFRRHEPLRTTFVEQDGKPVQRVATPRPFHLEVSELTVAPGEDREAAVQRFLDEEVNRPFDLSNGPLFRPRLLRLAPQEHVLLLTVHHIAVDAWSLEILHRELTAAYAQALAGSVLPAPELPVQYADYAQWQRTLMAGPVFEQQLAFWKKQLRGAPAVLDLPADHPRPLAQSFRGAATAARPLPAQVMAKLKAAAAEEGVTLFMALAGAFQILVARYTGQEDLVVGTPASGRTRTELEGLIGLFINMLAVRTDLRGNPDYREVLRRVRASVLGAFANQDIPFEKLVEALQPVRDTSRPPLFQLTVALHRVGAPAGFQGLTARSVEGSLDVSNYDLSLHVFEEGERFTSRLQYNTDLFEPETIDRLHGHLHGLLGALAADSRARVQDVQFLSEAEKAEVLVELNRVPVDWARVGLTAEEPLSFPAAFERQAALTPDAPAARFGDVQLSYAQLNARANQVAHALLAAGVTPDSVVGLLLERSLHFLVGMLAVFKAGAAYTPLDPSSPPLRLKGVVDQARCTALLCLSSSAPLASSLLSEPSRVLRLDALPSGLSSSNPGLVLSPRRLAYVIFTSGSTGTPKGAMVDHGGMHNHLRAKVHDLRLTSRDVLVETAPASFDISVWQFLVALRVGGSVVIADDDTTKDPLRLLRLVADCGITVLEIVPSLLGALLDTLPSPAPKLPSLRWLMLTGEALPPSLCTGWLRHYPSIPLVNAYGPTECSDDVTHHFLSSPPDESRGRTPIGRPIPNLLLYVLNSHLQPVPRGVEGELFVAGAGVGRGYLRDPVRTADVFLPNPFASSPGDRLYRTGDLCRFLPDGTLEFLGRIDHQVKVRGFRIELGEIEAALLRHPSIREAVVLARQDVPGDKQLCAYFLSSAEVSSSALTAHLRQYLPEYMVPAAFVSLPAWPLTPNGKLDRSALPAPDSLQNAADFVPPQGPLQELLASLWAQLLNVPRVGANDNFFQLGGHSLLAMRLVSQIRRSLSLELPIRALFEEPTLSRLASRLQLPDEASAGEPPPLVALPHGASLPASFAQERLWFLDQLVPGSSVYNILLAQELSGRLDVAALTAALTEILRRHEVLRTTYRYEGGRLHQVVSPAAPVALAREELGALQGEARRAEIRKRVDEEINRPMDLATGPVLQARLLRLTDDDHVLFILVHHIAMDGWSGGVLRRELSALYAAYCRKEPSPLRELPLQYGDYSAWQRRMLEEGQLDRQLDYWRAQLAELPSALELPTDRPRPALQTFSGALTPEIRFTGPALARLRELCREEGATPFILLSALFHVLLFRHSGQQDIPVGVPIAGRTRGELEPLIGMFINNLVLRLRLSGHRSFRQTLRLAREVALGAFAHQEYPFEGLVEALKPPRDLSRSPLFQVMFDYQRVGAEPELPGLKSKPLDPDTLTAKYDLIFHVLELDDELRTQMEFNVDLFDASTARRLLQHAAALLEGALARPELPIDELPMLSPAEQKQLLYDWNDTALPQAPGTLHQPFFERAAREPAALALTHEGGSLTYGELAARASQLAHWLQRRGVRPETRVAVCFERTVDLVVSVLGICAAGGAYVPIDPKYPQNRMGYMAQNTGSRLLLSHSSLADKLPQGPERAFVDQLAPELAALPSTPPAVRGLTPQSLAYIIHTSGSTGVPKGVMVRHAPAVNLVRWVNDTYGVGPKDRLLFVTSICFDLSVYDVFGTLAVGASFHLASDEDIRDPRRLVALLLDRKITFWDSAPTALQQVDAVCETGGPDLRLIFLSGDWIPLGLPDSMRRKFPNAQVVGLGGATEATVWSNHFPVGKIDPAWKSIPYGRPIQNARYYVLNAALRPCPVGVAGDLFIGGPCLAEGYSNDPVLTASKFMPDPYTSEPGAKMYRTGDRARFFPDGNIEFLGRLDHQVKIRGFRIELGEIEAVLRKHPGVKEAVVIAREDTPGDKRLVAYLIPAGGEELPTRELRAFLLQNLPEYMLPSAFIGLQSFPVTANGKLDRAALPRPDAAAGDAHFVPPSTALEKAVAEIWQEVLQLPRVSADANFFELGGHSLLATRMVTRLREQLGLDLPLRVAFEEPVLANLARAVGAASAGEPDAGAAAAPAADALTPAPRGAPLPASFAQERLWFLEKLHPQSGVYNVPLALRLLGPLAPGAVERALQQIAQRHEALRTTFALVDGQLLQKISPEAAVRFPLEDLRALPPFERAAALQRRLAELRNAPFDLENGPLWRGCLLQLGPEEHVLAMAMHHIVTDGSSVELLGKELLARLQGTPDAQLPPLPIQYADYAAWQRRWFAEGGHQAQLAFWRQQLAGAPQALELPTDRPRPALQSYRGRLSPSVRLPAALLPGLKEVAQRCGVTLSMLLQTGFQLLLHRYSRQEDLCIGVPIAGRRRRELEELLGVFLNTLVLRLRFDGARTFDALLARSREVTLAAYEHQDIPFEKLVEELKPARDTSRPPFFQVLFNFQKVGELPATAGLRFETLEGETDTSKFDLSLLVLEDARGVAFQWEFNTDLYDDDSVSRLSAHYLNLLEGIRARPDAPLLELPLLSSAERAELVTRWNETGAPAPTEPLHRLFEAQASRTPHQVALQLGTQQLTYAQLNARANQLARLLQSRGVQPDGCVGIFLERSVEMVVAIYAALKAGAAYLPLDPTLPAARLQYVLEQARPGAVVTLESLRARLPAAQGLPVVALDGRPEAGQAAENLHAPVRGGQSAYVIYTSGSTGAPKGVVSTHEGITNRLRWMQSAYPLSETDRVLQKTPFGFDVSVWELFWPLQVGGQLVVAKPEGHKDPTYLAELMRETGITVLHFVPSMLEAFLEAADFAPLTALRRVFCSGEALSRTVAERFFAQVAGNARRPGLHNLYGPTEASVDVSFYDLTPGADGRTVPIGWPVSNTQLHVLDAALGPVPLGVTGELYLGGVQLARGYLGRPELTAERFVPDPFGQGARLYRTGDLARRRADGAVEFLGRADHQVKLRGFRIELGEIEAELCRHPGIREAAVLARHDPGAPQQLVAYVLTRAGATPPVPELRAQLASALPEYMVPSAFVFLERWPLGATGKLDRAALPAPAAQAPAQAFVAPRGPLQELIASVWAELLKRPRVGAQDHFFELGGHSLLAIRMLTQLRERAGVELPLQTVFEKPTVAQLARHVETQMADSSKPSLSQIPRRADPQSAPASFSQERLWFVDQLLGPSALYGIPLARRLRGALQPRALDAAFTEVVRRHEALRTTFELVDGKPVQLVAPPQPVTVAQEDLSASPDPERALRARIDEELARPFDLKAGPLLRPTLFRLGADDHALLVLVHHIVSDGWSLDVLYGELVAAYAAAVAGRPAQLPELAIQYGDYAAWQRQTLAGAALERELNYWSEELAGAPTAIELPTDHPRPAVLSNRGARVTATYSPALSEGLRALARREDATLFMLVHAAFQLLLYRYSGQRDLVVGTTIAGRDRLDTERLIGLFINNLVLRGRLEPGKGFRALLAQLRGTTLRAFEHQALPFEKLVEHLAPERNLNRAPYSSVVFDLQPAQSLERDVGGLRGGPVELGFDSVKFELALLVTDAPGGLGAELQFNTDLFQEQTARRMLGNFETLLHGIVSSPDAALDALPLLTPAERKTLLVEWNGRAAPVPTERLHQLFEQQVARTPDAPAALFEAQSLTYRQLDEQANKLAHHLRKRGVGPDVMVGLCLDRGLDLLIAALAILKAGGVYVPLEPSLPAERLGQLMEDAGVFLLVTQEQLEDQVPSGGEQRVVLDSLWDRLEVEPATPPADTGVLPGHLAYVIFTSGSTGRPKGVQISHRSVCNTLRTAVEECGFAPGQRVLQFSSIGFDASVQELFGALAGGAAVVFLAREELLPGPLLTRRLREYQITTLIAATPVVAAMDPENLPALKTVVVGGEGPSAELVARWGEGRRFVQQYGPTETTISAASHVCVPGEGKPPFGRAYANVQLYVLDAAREPVPVGVAGELFIGGRGVARGYGGRPDLTAERFVPDPFGAEGGRLYRTGDRVRYRQDGNLEFLGRADDQVKIRGFRIELGEIEAALLQHRAVKECVVLAREDIPGEKRLVAYCVGEEALPDALRTYLQAKLPDHMVPSAILVLPQLPLTPNGKVDRRALPSPEEHTGATKTVVVPKGRVEELLVEIWKELLKLETLSTEDNFFDLGGHSLLATQLIGRIQEAFLLELAVADVFSHQTVVALAELILQRQSEQDSALHTGEQRSALVRLRNEGTRPPLVCVHPSGGIAHAFGYLAQLLEDQPALAFQAPELNSELTFDTIEERAAHYVGLLRAQVPSGPYLLAGFSSGGIPAYEMALQLARAGEKVELFLLDCAAGISLTTDDAQPKPRSSWRTGLALYLETLGPARLEQLQHAQDDSEREQVVLADLKDKGALAPNATVDRMRGILRSVESTQAVEAYRVRPAQFPVTVLASDETVAQFGPDLGWTPFASALTVHKVGGPHYALITYPYANEVARVISERCAALATPGERQ